MINNKSVVAIVVARLGSKGLPDKNIELLVEGFSLVGPILAARQSYFRDKTIGLITKMGVARVLR